jgi:sensor histidine kinase YesM
VTDDGPGMDAEVIAEYNKGFLEAGGRFTLHIGLGNLNQRIRLLFGEQ